MVNKKEVLNVQPHSIDAEQAVLGSMLTDKDAVNKAFEKKISSYTKAKYSVATSSGTAALHLALKYFDLGQNDEVLVPSLTYVATANAVSYCGETQNFLDIENESLSIFVGSDFVKSSIEKKLYKKIKKTFNISTGFKECVFVLDKNMKKDFQAYEFEEKNEDLLKNQEEIKKVQPDLSVFDEMFVGSSNNLSVTAAKNVVKDPGGRFNPLFVYGSPGVGKTHLLKTIEKAHPSSFYIDSESFLDSYIQGIKNKDIDIFK